MTAPGVGLLAIGATLWLLPQAAPWFTLLSGVMLGGGAVCLWFGLTRGDY